MSSATSHAPTATATSSPGGGAEIGGGAVASQQLTLKERLTGRKSPPAVSAGESPVKDAAADAQPKPPEPVPAPDKGDLTHTDSWEAGRAVSGEIRNASGEVILKPSDIVDITPKLEYDLYQKVDTLMSIIGNRDDLDAVLRDKHLSKFAKVIRELYKDQWHNAASTGEWKKLAQAKDKAEQKKILDKLKKEKTHLFGSLDQLLEAQGFVEQCSHAIATQLGYDMTNGGTRELKFDLPSLNDQKRIVQENTPNNIQTLLHKLQEAWKKKDNAQFAAVLNLGGVEILEYIIGHSIHHADTKTALAMSSTALVALGAGKAWRWAIAEGAKGDAISFSVKFDPTVEGALPFDPKDPIASHYAGKAAEAQHFLKETVGIGKEISRALKIPDWQADISTENLGNDPRGRNLRFKLHFAENLTRILSSGEYPDAHGQLHNLPAAERRRVVERAYDAAGMDYGEGTLREISEKVATREAMGEEDRKNWADSLSKLGNNLKDGTVVLHHPEKTQTLEELQKEVDALQRTYDSQQKAKAEFDGSFDEVDQARKAYRSAKNALQTIQTTSGITIQRDTATGKVTLTESSTGKITDLREQKDTTLPDQLADIYKRMGYDPATRANVPGDLREKYASAKNELAKVTAEIESMKKMQNAYHEQIKAEYRKKTPNLTTIGSLDTKLDTLNGQLAGKYDAKRDAELKYEPLKEEYEPIVEELSELNKKQREMPGKIRTLQQSVIDQFATVEATQAEYDVKFGDLKKTLLVLGYTQAEIDDPNFEFPSKETLAAKVEEKKKKLDEKTGDLTKAKEQEKGTAKAEASEEDKEWGEAILLATTAFTAERLNSAVVRVGTRIVSGEQLSERHADAGVWRIRELLLGEEITIPGATRDRAQKLLSKGMLTEVAMKTWDLDRRLDSFFQDNPQALANYRQAQGNSARIESAQRNIMRLEQSKQPGWERETTALRREIAALNQNKEELLTLVYDEKISPLMGADRWQTATFVREVADELYARCRTGSPYNEVVGNLGAAPTSETRALPEGSVTLAQPAREPISGTLIDRGAMRIENPDGLPETAIHTFTTSRGAAGKINLEVHMGKNDAVLARLPATVTADFPQELAFMLYDHSTGNRRSVDEINTFIDSIADVAAIQARSLPYEKPLLRMLFDVTSEGPPPVFGRKKPSSEIKAFALSREGLSRTAVEKQLKPLSLDRTYLRGTGRMLILTDPMMNQELLSDQFKNITLARVGGRNRFAGLDHFVVQNENGTITAFYQVGPTRRNYSVPLSTLLSGVPLEGTGVVLAPNEINRILDQVGRNGIDAARRKR